MNAVIDTNVVAYFVLGTDRFVDEARTFMEALDAAWATAVLGSRNGERPLDGDPAQGADNRRGLQAVGVHGRMSIHAVPNRTLWQGALLRSHQSKIAVYDTLFVELAVREQLPLATFDSALLKAFPNIAVRPAALCSA